MANRLITFTTAFATVPTPRDTIYSYGTSTVFYKEFRIVSISLNIDLTRHISAIEYDADVYNLVAMTLPVRVESLLPNPFQPPASVTDLSLSIQDTLNSQRIRENRIEVFYNIPEFVPGAGYGLWDHANIYISAPQPWPAGGDGGWTKIGITNKIQFRTVRIEYPATYYIKVVSVSPNGAEEPFDTAPTASILVTDDTSIPLQSFTVFVDTAGNAQYTNIQDAIDALPAEGGIVHVMNGLYTESNILINKSNVQVQGSGGSTIIQSDGSADNIFNITALGAATIENISISNLTIDCLDLALSGIYVSGLTDLILVENFTFTDIIIKGAVDHNLWIEKDVYNGIIKGQFIDSLTGDGIHIGI